MLVMQFPRAPPFMHQWARSRRLVRRYCMWKMLGLFNPKREAEFVIPLG